MTKQKDILNTMAAGDLASFGVKAATEQYAQDMPINQVYILLNIL